MKKVTIGLLTNRSSCCILRGIEFQIREYLKKNKEVPANFAYLYDGRQEPADILLYYFDPRYRDYPRLAQNVSLFIFGEGVDIEHPSLSGFSKIIPFDHNTEGYFLSALLREIRNRLSNPHAHS